MKMADKVARLEARLGLMDAQLGVLREQLRAAPTAAPRAGRAAWNGARADGRRDGAVKVLRLTGDASDGLGAEQQIVTDASGRVRLVSRPRPIRPMAARTR